MKISYLHTTPVPQMSGTDALYNEILLLHNHFGGSTTCLYPFRKPNSSYPIPLFGLHNLREIKRKEKETQLNHIFSPSLFHLPFARCLSNKTVYCIAGSLPPRFKLPSPTFLRKIDAFVVSNERDYRVLGAAGLPVEIIRTGIDVSPFTPQEKELTGDLVLLMASAPWEKAQFISKGIHLILKTLQGLSGIRVLFVWRNLLPDQMAALIQDYGVSDKVELINEKLSMAAIYERVHGTLLLVNDPLIVKAYPHSLIESVLSGKPVIASAQIPMSDDLKARQYGLVLEQFEAPALRVLFENFRDRYSALAHNARNIDRALFSDASMVRQYEALYSRLLHL